MLPRLLSAQPTNHQVSFLWKATNLTLSANENCPGIHFRKNPFLGVLSLVSFPNPGIHVSPSQKCPLVLLIVDSDVSTGSAFVLNFLH